MGVHKVPMGSAAQHRSMDTVTNARKSKSVSCYRPHNEAQSDTISAGLDWTLFTMKLSKRSEEQYA